MANPIVVELLLRGMPDVTRALRTVEQAATAADRSRERVAAQSSRQRTRVEEQEAKAKIRAMLQADRMQKQAQDRATREAERAARSRVRAAESMERAESRAAERSANEKLRIQRQVDREITAMEKRRARENDRLLREGRRAEERTHREQTKMLQERERASQRFARGTANRLASAGRTGLQQAAGVGTMLGQLGGGFSIADSVEREVGLTRQAGKIAASTVVGEGESRPSTQEILGTARKTGLAQGIDPKEILDGIEKFKDLTGDTNRAMQIMPDIAKLATAFGGDIGELAENAANLKIAVEKEGTKLDNADIMKLLRVQTRQGAVGAVELKDMAKYGGRLTAGASLFEGDRATNIATLGAFAQVARQRGGASSPAEAMMAAQRFATDIQGKADILKDAGIDIHGAEGKMKDPRLIIKEMLEKTGGDVTKLKEMGLGERGVRVLTGFSDIYTKAGGGKAGMAKVDEELKKFTEGVSDAEITMRANERMLDADRQLERAMIELRTAVGTQLLPEFLKMVPVLRDAIPTMTKLLEGFTRLADFAIRNPLAGLSVMIGAAFAKELAAAAIGKLIESALSSKLATSTIAVGSAIMAIATAKMMIEQEFKEEADAQRGAVGRQTEAANLIAKMNRGEQLSPEEQEKAQKVLAGLKTDVRKQVELREDPGLAKVASGAMANIVAPEQAKEAALAEERNRQETIKNLNETMRQLQAAIDRNTSATQGNTGAAAGAGGAGTPPVPRPPAASTGIVQRAQ